MANDGVLTSAMDQARRTALHLWREPRGDGAAPRGEDASNAGGHAGRPDAATPEQWSRVLARPASISARRQEQTARPRRVLVFRSGAPWLFEEAVSHLLSSADDVTVDVFSPRAYAAKLRERDDLGEVFEDGWDGIFELSNITRPLVGKLRRRRYDQVVIIYSNVFGENYDTLRRLAFKVRAGHVSTFNIRRMWSTLRGEGVVGRYLMPRRWAYDALTVVFSAEVILTAAWDRLRYRLGVYPPARMPVPERTKLQLRRR